MVTEKRKRTDLSVPSWLKDEFENGSNQKEEMAENLQQVNWCKDRLSVVNALQQIYKSYQCWGSTKPSTTFESQEKFVDEMQRIITSRKKVSITRDEGWYSESEMKVDLKWSQYLG